MARFARNAISSRTFILAFVFFCSVSPISAQILAVGDDTSTPTEGTGHDYIKLLSETVNPANGSLSLRIQAPTAKGRGITLPFSLAYDSNGVNHMTVGVATSDISFVSQGGWAYSVPMLSSSFYTVTTTLGGGTVLSCAFTSYYTFQDPSGGRHPLGLSATGIQTNTGLLCDNAVVDKGDTFYQGSLVTTPTSGNTNPPVQVSDADGTVYYFSNPERYEVPTCGSTCYSALPDYIEDRNGNVLSISPSAGAGVFAITDTVGRPAITSNGLGPSGNTNTLSVSGMNYKVAWTTTTPNFTFPSIVSYFPGSGYYCPLAGSANVAETVISSITLPNNQQYKFYYGDNNPNGYSNPYGLLSEIDYPSGAWVRYTWKMSDQYSEAFTEDAINETGGGNTSNGCHLEYKTPVVATRTVGFTQSSTPSLTQTFTYTTTWNPDTGNDQESSWTQKTTKVTTTDSVRSLTSLTSYTYGGLNSYANNPYASVPQAASQIPMEQIVQYYDWGAKGSGTNGSLIRTVNKTWANINQIASEQTVLNDDESLTSKTTYTYTGGVIINGASSGVLSQLQNKYDYDYGLTLLRSTTTNYQPFATTPVGGSIMDKPCQTITYDGNNPPNKYAETDYFYDGGTTLCAQVTQPSSVGNVPGLLASTHDPNYGPTSTSPRGNLTQKAQWASVGTSPATTYTYDETGQVLTMVDPCGNGSCSDVTGTTHTTMYSYNDNYTVLSGSTNKSYTPSGVTNAYLTTMTDPLGYSDSFSYDYYNGQLTDSTDVANKQSTTYLYNDPLARPTLVNYPDQGETEIAYNDSPPVSITTCRLINGTPGATCNATSAPTGWETNISVMDGAGHVVQTELASDPDGITYTAASYDGVGRTYMATNPYRTTTDSTYGTTTYTYDALGRTKQISEPDGSSVTTTYTGTQTTGAATTVADEVGNQRTSLTDGLGRLTYVLEAPTSYNYQTVYAYDPLNNLLSVNQTGGSRTRTFTYDSLSRLLCAANPEVQIVTCPASATGTFPKGAVTYAYDANSNLSTKVAPKPGQATGTATVTTSYSYDALNRLTEKSYVGLSTTPVKFGYDGGTAPACGQDPPQITGATNLVGRRSAMCAYDSGSSWSYDPMGRPLIESRTNKVSKEYTYKVNYTYNKDGSLSTLTYPSGDTVTYTPGGAGRPLGVSDSVNTYVASGTSNHATYTPNGALVSMANGYTTSPSFAGIVTSNIYSDRLQPILLSASTPSSSVFSLCYDFHLGAAINTSPCPSLQKYGTGDNGNVFQVLNTLDGTRSAVFTYDPLNRISQANTVNTNSTNCWGEAYTIDAWGNLTNRAPAPGMAGNCLTEGLNTSANGQNQLSGISYDIAGNVLNDGNGNTPTYDAENRMTADAGVTYSYDADGVRMEKSSGTMYWPGPSGEYLTETDLAGSINEEYIYFNGARIARVDRPSGVVHYYFSDTLRSASVITDASGNVEQQYFYLPYGGLAASIGSDSNHYKFTGKERDSESNLDYFGARYYASTMGRFMTPDWSASSNPDPVPYVDLRNPQSLNLYGYVKNNPTTLTDPNGHCDVDGEHHNWVWCAAHAIGITQTQKEQADAARQILAGLKNMTLNGQTPAEYARTATNQQAIAAERIVAEYFTGVAMERLASGGCPEGAKCGIVFPVDFATKGTNNWSATFESEGEARAFARTKLGSDAVEVEPGKWRSADGKWQYRAKPGDVSENHAHLEQLNPQTGEVMQNVHLRWPEGTGR